jgi:hypothetical protein
MLRFETLRTAGLVWPIAATAAVSALALRSRDFANGSSPGSGVTIVLSELLSRIPELAHAAVSVGDRATMLLVRMATAPASFAVSVLESEFHFAFAALGSLGSTLQSAASVLFHTL